MEQHPPRSTNAEIMKGDIAKTTAKKYCWYADEWAKFVSINIYTYLAFPPKIILTVSLNFISSTFMLLGEKNQFKH